MVSNNKPATDGWFKVYIPSAGTDSTDDKGKRVMRFLLCEINSMPIV